MEMRRIREGEGTELRALRLKALADAPRAFATTLAEAEKVPGEEWEQRARRYAGGEQDVMFVAVEDGRWYGVAGGYFPPDQPGVVHLFSMWVDPERRRSGLGISLVESVVGWARERGAPRIQLWVTRENVAARSLYLRAGFAETNQAKPLPSSPDLDEILMSQEL